MESQQISIKFTLISRNVFEMSIQPLLFISMRLLIWKIMSDFITYLNVKISHHFLSTLKSYDSFKTYDYKEKKQSLF